MSKNIEMNYKIDSGYEVIYPMIKTENVIDLDTVINAKLGFNKSTYNFSINNMSFESIASFQYFTIPLNFSYPIIFLNITGEINFYCLVPHENSNVTFLIDLDQDGNRFHYSSTEIYFQNSSAQTINENKSLGNTCFILSLFGEQVWDVDNYPYFSVAPVSVDSNNNVFTVFRADNTNSTNIGLGFHSDNMNNVFSATGTIIVDVYELVLP